MSLLGAQTIKIFPVVNRDVERYGGQGTAKIEHTS